MLAVGFAKLAFGDGLTAESAHYELRHVTETGGLALVFLLMRAFASGCTALTGVEAVSNGVPAFEEPKSRNAATTLVIMGVLSITMFAGITALAIASHVHMAEDPANLIGLARRRRAAHRDQPDRDRYVRRDAFRSICCRGLRRRS